MLYDFQLLFVIYSIIFISGIIIGSFLNVCIYRIPIGESIVFGSSHCFNCKNRIKWFDLVPVLSYIILGGKCRYCKSKISPQYPLIEFINGILYVITFSALGFTLEALIYSLFISALIVVSMIDFRTMMIPNGVSIAIGILGIGAAVLLRDIPITGRLIGAVVISVPLGIIALATSGIGENGGMGWGDVKLMAASGLVLGWKAALLAFLIGSITGAVIGIILKLSKGLKEIPFGPFLSVGLICAALFYNQITDWYLGLFL